MITFIGKDAGIPWHNLLFGFQALLTNAILYDLLYLVNRLFSKIFNKSLLSLDIKLSDTTWSYGRSSINKVLTGFLLIFQWLIDTECYG